MHWLRENDSSGNERDPESDSSSSNSCSSNGDGDSDGDSSKDVNHDNVGATKAPTPRQDVLAERSTRREWAFVTKKNPIDFGLFS